MNRPALVVVALLPLASLPGCYRDCSGGWSPAWVHVDCFAPMDTADDTDADDADDTDTADDTDPQDTDPGCDLALTLTIDGGAVAEASPSDTVSLRAVATNVSGGTLDVAMIEQCPAGQALFSGLGDGFDYYGTCVMGACEDSGQTFVETLVPGGALTVEVSVPLGGGTCNAAVDPGAYSLTFALPLVGEDVTVCPPAAAALAVTTPPA